MHVCVRYLYFLTRTPISPIYLLLGGIGQCNGEYWAALYVLLVIISLLDGLIKSQLTFVGLGQRH